VEKLTAIPRLPNCINEGSIYGPRGLVEVIKPSFGKIWLYGLELRVLVSNLID